MGDEVGWGRKTRLGNGIESVVEGYGHLLLLGYNNFKAFNLLQRYFKCSRGGIIEVNS